MSYIFSKQPPSEGKCELSLSYSDSLFNKKIYICRYPSAKALVRVVLNHDLKIVGNGLVL